MSSKGSYSGASESESDVIDAADLVTLFAGTRNNIEDDAEDDKLAIDTLAELGERMGCLRCGLGGVGKMGLSVGLARLIIAFAGCFLAGVERAVRRAYRGRPAGHSGVTRRREDPVEPNEF